MRACVPACKAELGQVKDCGAFASSVDTGLTGRTDSRSPEVLQKSPDGISVELLQEGQALEAAEPWASMENTGSW